MGLSTAIPTILKKTEVTSTGSQLKFDTDTLKVLLVGPGSGAPNTQSNGIQWVSDVTATNTECSGVGYSRQTLSGVTVAYDASPSTTVDFSFGNITFSQNASGFTNARYAIFYDGTVGTVDTNSPVFAVCDLSQTYGVTGGDLVLSAPAGGLIQWS